MYESKTKTPIPHKLFIKRVALHTVIATGLLLLSLAIGMAGYMHYEQLAWRDAFLNSAMLMGGMGPVDAPKTDDGKVFAGLYALYAGLVFIVTVGLVLTPIVHRIMHRFHWQQDSKA
ncbi:MAG TPA: hypothetical protein VK950_00265 [Methylophilus sp.]|nr:hypothetical protein [Methylophilus sp.]